MSSGFYSPYPNYCDSNPSYAICLAITYASNRDIVMMAASGNGRQKLDFLARDPRVVSAGGFHPNLALWDDSRAAGRADCLPSAGAAQCGQAGDGPGASRQ